MQAFIVISDLFVSARTEGLNNINRILPVLNSALQATLYQPEKDDIELCEYFKSLREALVECLTCLLHCTKDTGKLDLFNPFANNVLAFVFKLCSDKYDLSIVRCFNF